MNQITTSQAPAAIGPYAQAVQIGDFVFTSGQIPLRPDGTLVEGDVRAQTEQVLKNLDAVLQAAGLRKENVVKATIFMTDLGQFQTVNEVYAEYLGAHRPARSTVQVAALPRGAQVEIEFIAHK
ncbi:RidA family protein [Alicyclobacillus cycloheptanicus]|jgi:2-iminobutanoate/2-iminopropanoate deaminase|uniref:2-iminobutanoate/2-iminopropanoate deaminase n=1 Tax=Alicyclobacillus cycloheptanicus TaxID=1457 RepID=A0ABT9XIM0_9BACL|nr:RidA family protein [Alicyclobacillus cycloheptanicus]MDQ0190164.1 2-iminobutanoate/2-iminopropanoate deaminase [Alicyclobacillus cycloheptanicus]WDM02581.1 RidA family protein [Alicyclobacillus cycloheptanicus]